MGFSYATVNIHIPGFTGPTVNIFFTGFNYSWVSKFLAVFIPMAAKRTRP
jgi:hypothetical protein